MGSSHRRTVIKPILVLGWILLLVGGPGLPEAWAQKPNLAENYDLAIRAISTGEYDNGLKAVDRILKAYGPGDQREIGPVFGHFYFLKGILHVKKKQWEPAVAAFKTCYEKYDNSDLTKIKPGENPRLPNRFRHLALVQWATVRLVQKKYDEALQLYGKALKAETKIEGMAPINRTLVHMNMGRCHLLKGQPKEGNKILRALIENENVPLYYRRECFLILAEDWSPKVSWDEVVELVHQRGDLILQAETSLRFRHNDLFLFLASDGLDKGEPLRALLWYGYLIPPNEVAEAYRGQIADIEAALEESEDEEEIAALKSRRAQARKNIDEQFTKLGQLLPAIGSSHFELRNFWGSFSTFQFLADHYPKHEDRPDTLYNLVNAGVQIEEWEPTLHYGLIFLDEFPDHALMPEVARMLVEVAFIKGRYQESYDIAIDVREKMKVGSPARDVPDFVTGGSLFHLSRLEEAEVELDAYIANYPEPKREEFGRYYQAVTKVALFKWAEASPLLDSFLKDFPDSDLRPGALYQSGLCKVILGDLEVAKERIAELQDRFPNADEIPPSYNLRGDILVTEEGPHEEIVSAYTQARELAYAKGEQEEVAAYALLQLINAHNRTEEWDKVTGYYDAFQERHAESDWRLDVTVGSLPALVEADRSPEAADRIEEFVLEFAEDAEAPELSEMFGTYLGFLEDQFPQKERLRRLREFPGFEPLARPQPLRALLLMGEIEFLEAEAKPGGPEQKKISSLYHEIHLDLEKIQIPNYVLVRLGRWNRDVQKKSLAARDYYDFVILQRPDGGFLEYALLDSAEMDVASNKAAALDNALNTFHRLLNEFDKPDLTERSVLGIARIHSARKEFEDAQSWWERYIDEPRWAVSRPEANFRYGECLEARGKKAEAMKVFVNVYANFAGHLDWSAPAYIKAATILHEAGKEKQSIMVLQDMLRKMGHHKHPQIHEAKKLFNDWVFEWRKKQEAK